MASARRADELGDLRHKFVRGLAEAAQELSRHSWQRPLHDQYTRSIVLLSIHKPLEAITSHRVAGGITGLGEAPEYLATTSLLHCSCDSHQPSIPF